MNDEPYKDFVFPLDFTIEHEITKKEAHVTIGKAIKGQKKWAEESFRHRQQVGREAYYQKPPEQRPRKPKGPEYRIVENYCGRNVRIKSKNRIPYLLRQDTRRRAILNQPHNVDMSTEPNKTLEGGFQEYTSTDENLPKRILKHTDREHADIEPWWCNKKPQLRKSWPEFCRDFIGQNYGSIAQALLEMNASDDPALRVQFMKFIMEMGKQGNPQSLQLDVNANVKSQTDIYAQLSTMAAMPIPLANQEPVAQIEAPEDYEPETTQYNEDSCNATDPVYCMACSKRNTCDRPLAHYAQEMNIESPNT